MAKRHAEETTPTTTSHAPAPPAGTPIDRAMLAYGLAPEHVIAAKLRDVDGRKVVTLVTAGGIKLRYPLAPGDTRRRLRDQDKTGIPPQPDPPVEAADHE